MMRDIIDCFLDQSLKPLERIRKIWFALFIIRFWRHSVLVKKNTTLKNNFMSANCYSCIEFNAHGLVMCMLHLKDSPELFLPHLFESQPCESIFRQFRSFTSTYSTVTNCTIKEASSRISKIQLQNDIMHGTSQHFCYPRLGKVQKFNAAEPITMPAKIEIFNEIESCKRDAIAKAKAVGLISNQQQRKYICKIPPYKSNTRKKIQLKKCTRNSTSKNYETALAPPNFRNIQLKNFADKLHEEIDVTSPYVEVPTDDYNRIVVKKRSLCWLWRSECQRLSSDRLLRVQYSEKKNKRTQIKMRAAKKTVYKRVQMCIKKNIKQF